MLSRAVTFQELGDLEPAAIIEMTRAFCLSGKQIHPESLRAVVLKLTYLSRNMHIKQEQRDEAANFATSLANAAIKTYGQQSDYTKALVHDIQMIMGQSAA
jgi:pantothenate synthetase